ncbi:MAG: hypothetical protein ACRD3O_19255, partial [Terriglobia bacterium]
MRRCAIVVFSFVFLVTLSGVAFSQSNPRGLSSVTLDGHKVSVDYGRPSLKGKTVEAAMKMPFEPGH